MQQENPISTEVNVGVRLSEAARLVTEQLAVAAARRKTTHFDTITFQQLDDDSSRIAAGLLAAGAKPGDRLVVLVKPGIDFISLVFALLKAGLVCVLVDPGMGKKNIARCLEEAEPDGFIAIPLAQAVLRFMKKRFPKAKINITVGNRWFWGGQTLDQLRKGPVGNFTPHAAKACDPAAIIFTSGSTGPPKGVLYLHGNFNRQIDEIRDRFQLQPGGVDLSGFPLFALFNGALGVTTIVPDMDFTRPAKANPRKILYAARKFKATQSFGSPALWTTVGRYCEAEGERLEQVRMVFSAGAPVPPHVLRSIKNTIHPEGEIFTPYGATEALPVAAISASEVLGETAEKTAQGAGVCVGSKFPHIAWKVIRITDQPLANINDVEELPGGEIGELMVQGEVVTREYVTRKEANALHKVKDGNDIWHRMGDVGYLDREQRFWFCGRKAHRVQTTAGVLFTIPCEAVFNEHPSVHRSALVGVGPAQRKTPILIAEPWPEKYPATAADIENLKEELLAIAARHEHTKAIGKILLRKEMPVDIRHNSKINRELLARWAVRRIV